MFRRLDEIPALGNDSKESLTAFSQYESRVRSVSFRFILRVKSRGVHGNTIGSLQKAASGLKSEHLARPGADHADHGPLTTDH